MVRARACGWECASFPPFPSKGSLGGRGEGGQEPGSVQKWHLPVLFHHLGLFCCFWAASVRRALTAWVDSLYKQREIGSK